jgi:hypothetical protein
MRIQASALSMVFSQSLVSLLHFSSQVKPVFDYVDKQNKT